MSYPNVELKDYYRFDDKAGRIVMQRHDVPTPWINYLSNGTLHAFVSQAGGGLAWWRTPLKARMTRYRMYNLPIDTPGFYVYLRQKDGTVWSPTFRPVETKLNKWECSHQPGLTRFVAKKGKLEATLELFIPPHANAVIWDLKLKNKGAENVDLDVFGYVELCLLDWKQDTDWSCYVKHNLQVTHDKDSDAIVYLYRHFHFNPILDKCPLTYFGSSEPTVSYTCDRDVFVGNYRYEKNPQAVENGRCGNEDNFCGEPCAALHNAITVPAGGEKRMQYFLGAEPQAIVEWPKALHGAKASLTALREPGAVDRHKSELEAWWKDHLGRFQAELPDADTKRQVNLWSPLQSVHTGRYSRSISFYAAGIRGCGFRDTCQDMMAVAYRKPDWATQGLKFLLSQQFDDGHTVHMCFPEDKMPPYAGVHIDNPLWLPMLTYAILAETGDFGLLGEKAPWLAADGLSANGEATVWEHLLRVVDFIESNLGAHGIPLTHKGDWNDSIGKFSKKGRGETLFAAQQYVHVLRLLVQMASGRGESATAERLQKCLDKQIAAISACAWDGKWWRRGFDDDGNPIGTESAQFGKIWLNTQSWSVISGLGTPDQNRTAMQAVKDHLDTGIGLQKLWPSYKTFPEVLDPYSGYSPGCGENGAIFCHANTWAIIAEALLGNADRAWGYYRQLIPHVALQKVGIQRYQAEPYAYVSNIIGPENPRFGWANVTQVTGTAAWMDIASSQYLLGVRSELGGLRVDPCIPQAWDGFSVKRLFRGCAVDIKVKNPGHVARGVKGVRVDGRDYPGSLIPNEALAGKTTAKVVVEMA